MTQVIKKFYDKKSSLARVIIFCIKIRTIFIFCGTIITKKPQKIFICKKIRIAKKIWKREIQTI